MIQPNPQKGKGSKEPECPHYEQCLDVALINNWRGWTCGFCTVLQPSKTIAQPLANKCKADGCNKPQFSDKNGKTYGYCRECLAARRNAGMAKSQRQPGSPKGPKSNLVTVTRPNCKHKYSIKACTRLRVEHCPECKAPFGVIAKRQYVAQTYTMEAAHA